MIISKKSSHRARTINESRKWKIALKIGDVWEEATKLDTEDEDEFDEFKLLIMSKLRRFYTKMETFMDDEDEIIALDDIIEQLDDSKDSQDWDYSWEDFYDWADDNDVFVETNEGPNENGDSSDENGDLESELER